MPSISGYHHLSLTVTDLGKSAQWYREVLGFETDAEFEGAGFRRVRLRRAEANVTLTLTCHDRGSADSFSELRTGMDHVAFLVASADAVEAWKQRFDELGVTHSEVKATGTGSGALVTLRDPDNIQLEVFAPGG